MGRKRVLTTSKTKPGAGSENATPAERTVQEQSETSISTVEGATAELEQTDSCKDVGVLVSSMKAASKQELEEAILSLVRLYHRRFHGQARFVPGKTRIPYAGRVYDETELTNLVDSALEFWLTAGRYAREFEREFSRYLGTKHVLLTNSGSSANLLAISSLTSRKLSTRRLKPGDEVITAAASFPTTVNPILQNGLVPVFVDIELGSYNVTAASVREAISGKSRAVLLAHTLGNPFELDGMQAIAKEHDLFLIEDACDALGSTFNGKKAGTVGHIGTFSFYPPHHITMGEGGALVTDDPQLARLMASFRDWGRDCWCEPGRDNSCGKRFSQKLGQLPLGYDHKYVYSEVGYNLKITDMQAAVGVAQLRKIEEFAERRRKNFKILRDGLKEYEDRFILPVASHSSDPSWFGLPLTLREDAGFSRSDIVSHLEESGISTRMLFAGNIVKQPYFADIPHRVSGNLTNTDTVMERTFWIGVYPGLTNEMLEYILETFWCFFASI